MSAGLQLKAPSPRSSARPVATPPAQWLVVEIEIQDRHCFALTHSTVDAILKHVAQMG